MDDSGGRYTVLRVAVTIMFSLLSANIVLAQNYTIQGKVYDQATGETLPFANVFLSHTTFGVASDTTGSYVLRVKGDGPRKIAVKYLGYEPFSTVVMLGEATVVDLNIYLTPSAYNIAGVTVTASGKRKKQYKTDSSTILRKGQRWRRHLHFFEPLFIGKTEMSLHCSILNSEVLEFEVFNDRDYVEVRASEPLIIENRALGYRLYYVLETYELYFDSQRLIFEGYPLFREMAAKNAKEAERWKRNRWEAYRGSYLHFFRSLYHNRLKEEGFEVALFQLPDPTPVVPEGRPLPRNDMTLLYIDLYEYMKPGQYRFSKNLWVPGMLAVVAANNVEEEGYIRPSEHRKLFGRESGYLRRNLQRSWLKVHDPVKGIEIGPNGHVYNGLNFIMNGYWAFEKVGDMLPLDYEPGVNPAAIAER